jgi:hypothetical protein
MPSNLHGPVDHSGPSGPKHDQSEENPVPGAMGRDEELVGKTVRMIGAPRLAR